MWSRDEVGILVQLNRDSGREVIAARLSDFSRSSLESSGCGFVTTSGVWSPLNRH